MSKRFGNNGIPGRGVEGRTTHDQARRGIAGRARGIRGFRRYRGKYTGGDKGPEGVSWGGAPAGSGQIPRAESARPFRPERRRLEEASPPPGRDERKRTFYLTVLPGRQGEVPRTRGNRFPSPGTSSNPTAGRSGWKAGWWKERN